MLVPGAGRALEGTGRPAELSPSGSNPVTGTAHRQEDKGGTITKPRRFSDRASSHTHTFGKFRISIFAWVSLIPMGLREFRGYLTYIPLPFILVSRSFNSI